MPAIGKQKMTAFWSNGDYYNDNSKHAAFWLSELVAQGCLPDGVVTADSIVDLVAGSLKIYRRVHLFAGIGGWAHALELAGWPRALPVWTGSCPCQPFSGAGKQLGEADERHLWPEMLRLINECRPPTIFGEQVASKLGREWLSRVRTDLEALGYAVGAADLCAASVSAPHKRQRIFWVADASWSSRQWTVLWDNERAHRSINHVGVGTPNSTAGPNGIRPYNVDGNLFQERRREEASNQSSDNGTTSNYWLPSDVVDFIDGGKRRIEPGTFPLAYGVPDSVELLRCYGNAIVPPLAATFVKSFIDVKINTPSQLKQTAPPPTAPPVQRV